MTTERTYKCNLCRDAIIPSPFASKSGFGVHFTAGGDAVLKTPSECENHICQQCAKNIHNELRKLIPAKEVEP